MASASRDGGDPKQPIKSSRSGSEADMRDRRLFARELDREAKHYRCTVLHVREYFELAPDLPDAQTARTALSSGTARFLLSMQRLRRNLERRSSGWTNTPKGRPD